MHRVPTLEHWNEREKSSFIVHHSSFYTRSLILPIKAITFDFWSTLYKGKPVNFAERIYRLKTDVEAGSGLEFEQAHFEAAVNVARATWSRTWIEDQRTLDAEAWLSIMLQYLGISLEPAYFRKMQTRMENSIFNERPTLVAEAPLVLASLSTRYRLGIISDTGLTLGRALRQILADDNVIGYFSHLTFSDEVGYSKPHPDPFLTTLAALEVEPGAAVHVGDLLRTDIAGAQGVGMRAVQYIGLNHDEWLQSIDAPVKDAVTPDAIIRNHTELEPLLRQW
jgi:putative hydrolase of the HAD superfamily